MEKYPKLDAWGLVMMCFAIFMLVICTLLLVGMAIIKIIDLIGG